MADNLIPVEHDPFLDEIPSSGVLPFGPSSPAAGGIRMTDGDMLALMNRSAPTAARMGAILPGSAAAESMTHQPEQPNPALPYVKGVFDFLHGGAYEVMKNRGVEFPDWVKTGAAVINNPNANAALGVIGGIGANLSTAQRLKLDWAKKATEGNLDPERIWAQTGWYLGKDKMWRMEVPSDAFKLKGSEKELESSDPSYRPKEFTFNHPDAAAGGRLPDFIEWPELFKKYPHLEHMTVAVVEPGEFGARGSFTPPEQLSQEIRQDHPFGIIRLLSGMDEAQTKRTLGHELQHTVQDWEQFLSRGSSPSTAANRATYEIRQRLEKYLSPDRIANLNQSDRRHAEELSQLYWYMVEKGDEFGYHLYRSNPGEIEAHLAAIRHSGPDAIKKKILPTHMQEELTRSGDFTPEFRFPHEFPEGSRWLPVEHDPFKQR